MLRRALFTLAVTVGVAAGCASPGAQQVTADGLVAVSSSTMDELYVRPDADIRAYRKIVIEPVSVQFRNDYLSQQHAYNRLKNLDPPYDEPQALARELAGLMRGSLVDAFVAAGYEVVSDAEPDALRAAAEVGDLYINAPDRLSASTRRSLARDAGEATLKLKISDSSGKQELARMSRRAPGRQANQLFIADNTTNRLWFDTLFHRWAAQVVAEVRR